MKTYLKIIEIVKQAMSERLLMHNFDIVINERYFNLAKCSISYNHTRVPHKIVMGVDFLSDEKWKDAHERRFGIFLDGVDITLNKYSIFLLFLLHECGHVVHFDLYGSKYTYHEKMRYSKHFISGIFKIPRTTKDIFGAKNRVYMFPDEIYADRFAFENFMSIWKKLKTFEQLED